MDHLLRLEDIRVHFYIRKMLFRSTTVRAVDGVTLRISKGITLALVGESGSGKTTLGRASLRLLKPTSGRCYFDDIDITDEPERRLKWLRRRAQAVFQDPYSSLDPFMNVYQTLEEPLIIHKIGNSSQKKDKVEKALEDVQMVPSSQFMPKYPHMLSGGQRQRLGVARALILEPDYILADEPVSMIDASSRVEILSLLRELQQRYGIAFLYITHDIATARYFSDQIGVMYLGKIVEMSTPEQIIQNPLHPYTKALIAAVPEPDPSNRFRERYTIPGDPPTPAHVPSGCSFHPRCPEFMKGTCDVVAPQLQEVRPGHFTSCHLYAGLDSLSQATDTAAP